MVRNTSYLDGKIRIIVFQLDKKPYVFFIINPWLIILYVHVFVLKQYLTISYVYWYRTRVYTKPIFLFFWFALNYFAQSGSARSD